MRQSAPTDVGIWVQRNFDKPVEWGMIKDYPWSTPQLRKLDVPVCPALMPRQRKQCRSNAGNLPHLSCSDAEV